MAIANQTDALVQADLVYNQTPQQIKQAEEEVTKIILRRTKQAAEIVAASVKAHAPRDSGQTANAVIVNNSAEDANWDATQPAPRGFIGHTVRVSQRYITGFYYPRVLEYGWVHKPGGVPFFRNGILASRDRAERIMRQAGREIQEL